MFFHFRSRSFLCRNTINEEQVEINKVNADNASITLLTE